jgi:hypothetical protein
LTADQFQRPLSFPPLPELEHEDYWPFGETHLTRGAIGAARVRNERTGNTELALLYADPNHSAFSLHIEDHLIARVELDKPNPTSKAIGLKAIQTTPAYPQAAWQLLSMVRPLVTHLWIPAQSPTQRSLYESLGFKLLGEEGDSSHYPRILALPEAVLQHMAAAVESDPLIRFIQPTDEPPARQYVRIPRPLRSSESPPRRFRVAVVDLYGPTRYNITPQGSGTLTHGQLVEAVLKANLPDGVEILPCPVESEPKQTNRLRPNAFSSALNHLLNTLTGSWFRRPVHVDAVNISLSSNNFFFDHVRQLFDLPVNRQNVALLRQDILRALKRVGQDIETRRIIQLLERISKRVPVFMSGGNRGAYDLNSFLLARGVRGVGSVDVTGKKSIFTADNALVTDWALGEYPVLPVKRQGTVSGYSLFGDDRVDIPAEQVDITPLDAYAEYDVDLVPPTIDVEGNPGILLTGTSFATPTAVARFLRGTS